MMNSIQLTIQQAEKLPRVDKQVINRFHSRIKQGSLVRSQNPKDHICVFFLPYDAQSKQVFLGHHIKSGLWLPPGGHIEENESPSQTVIREAQEELGIELNQKDMKLIDLSVTDITLKKYSCQRHYDIWYLIPMRSTELNPSNKEFHSGEWMSVMKAVNHLEDAEQKSVSQKLYS